VAAVSGGGARGRRRRVARRRQGALRGRDRSLRSRGAGQPRHPLPVPAPARPARRAPSDGLSDALRSNWSPRPLAASRMEATNARRVVRALEVTLGRPTLLLLRRGSADLRASARRAGRDALRLCEPSTCASRRAFGLAGGRLARRGGGLARTPGGLSRTARQAVGYRELLRHVEGGEPLEECVNDAIAQSRRLARRQRSWFQRDPRIEWFDDPKPPRAPPRRAGKSRRLRERLGTNGLAIPTEVARSGQRLPDRRGERARRAVVGTLRTPVRSADARPASAPTD
jgi:hypothetical protein